MTHNLNSMKVLLTTLFLTGFLLSACSSDDSTDRQSQAAADTQEQGLTEFELEHGIGPVTERIEISDEIDQDKVIRGRDIYEMKCEMCHNMEGRMVGPQLGDVTEYRSPEFIMNFILNPGGMVREHPVGKELLAEYMTAMPFQNVKEDEARDIVEFLRYYAKNN
jgi:cytochrome c5